MAKKVELKEGQLRDAERWSWVTAALSAACAAAAYSGHDKQWLGWVGAALAFVLLASFWRHKRLTRR
jgi:hypothetical protein